MQYKVVGYQGNNIYYVVCQEVQQSVYNNLLLTIGETYEGYLDYSHSVNGYPMLRLDDVERLSRRGISRGIK